jgi:GT2 family glycosyltransferase
VKYSVIIPSKDRQDILAFTLDRLSYVNNLRDLQVIIINDSELQIDLDDQYSFIEIYKNEGHGVAAARNHGVGKAVNDWLVFMDDDIWVQPDTFEKLLPFSTNEVHCLNINWIYPDELIQQRKRLPFLRYLHKYGFDSLKGWNSDIEWDDTNVFEVNGITSQFLLVHKKTFQEVGGYRTDFPFAGFEDYDMSKRLKLLGSKIYMDPGNLIFHNESDRIDVEQWLERKKRGAVSRKVAVNLGYKELELQYNIYKTLIYKAIYFFRKNVLFILKRWPNIRKLDKLYFTFVNVMLGTYSCIGYKAR